MVSKKSFTLVEVLVVITIITILAGMILGGIGGATTQSLKANTKSTLTTLTSAIEKYKEKNGDYPAEWLSPRWTDLAYSGNNLGTHIVQLLNYESFPVATSGCVIDNWDKGIRFIPAIHYGFSSSNVAVNPSLLPGVYYNPNTFQLISAGPDGIFGNGDDIYNFEKK